MKSKPKTMKSSKNNQNPPPFADITNNLTPLSSLRSLCNSTNFPPISAKQYNSSKPFKENRVSSSVVDPGCSYRVEFINPSKGIATPPTPPLGQAGSGEHSYNRRQSDVKAKEAIYGLPDSFLVDKDGEKAIRMSSSCPITLETILDKNLTAVPSSHLRSSLPQENKDKEKAIDVTPIRPALLKTNTDKGKAIALTPPRPAPLKPVNKGIVFVDPSDETRSKIKSISSPFDKPKVKGIDIQKPSVTSGSCHLTRDHDKCKASPRKSRHPIILSDLKGKVKKTPAPCDGLLSETRNKDALLTPLSLSSKKADHNRKSLAMPSDCQPPFKPDEKLVKEVELFTCPPLQRTRNTRKRTTKDEDSQLPKSWTDPHPKKPKTRRVKKEADQLDFLPKDFVEKYRAYFKEVDEFELLEEEVSCDDSDKD